MRRSFRLLALAAFVLVACQTTPYGVVSSIEAERALGEERLPGFLEAKGGLYDDRDAEAYIRELSAKLSAHAAIPPEYLPISVSILDTNVPSAYALPGGSIFLSRGIIAMANDEAQLAGVIAHEIGHVMARHIAQGIASKERLVQDIIRQSETRLRLAGTRSQRIAIVEKELEARLGDITAWSKEQELEADQIAMKTLTAAGYDPRGFGDLLRRLSLWQDQRGERIGVTPEKMAELSRRSGYPKIEERVAALGVAAPGKDAITSDRNRLMSVIDGMRFDDGFEGGFIRDGRYWNGERRLTFDVPGRFYPQHGEHLRLVGVDGLVVMRIDEIEDADFDAIISRIADSELGFGRMTRTTINGIPAARATSRATEKGETFVGKVALYDLGAFTASLLLFTKDSDLEKVDSFYQTMVGSLRRITPGEAPPRRRYKARRMAAGETLSGLAAQSAYNYNSEEQLRLLNSLMPGTEPRSGDWIKLVK